MQIIDGFFAYKYDTNTVVKENVTDTNVITNQNINNTVGQVYRLAKKTKLYSDANMSKSYNYLKGTKVTVLENVSTTNTVLKKTYRTKSNTKMYKNANLTKAYNYLKNTKVTLLSKSNNIAKVRVNKTNLIRYINMKYLKHIN